jgi:hypothetical protein
MLSFFNIFVAGFILLSLTVANLFLPLASKKSRTILDYYLLVPQRYLQLKGEDSQAAREVAIKIKDMENGYLQIRPQADAETYTALTLFKKVDGTDLIAIEARSCAQGCLSRLTLLVHDKDQWVDITSQRLPLIDDLTLRDILNKQITSKKENLGDFTPRILYTLPRGGSVIDVHEHWSGMEVGRLEWDDGQFVFRAAASPKLVNRQAVLASASNEAGDRLEIIGFNPEHPVKLPLKGQLRVSIAYELTSAQKCLIWVLPIINEKRLPDHFSSGSMFHKQGPGIATRYIGFNNQAHIDQLKVVMADEQHKELLTLIYNLDADWEGVKQCPGLNVRCFSKGPNSTIPISCTVYLSGLQPGQHLTYHWTMSGADILSGQGTHHIKINSGGKENVTATVEVGGLGRTCDGIASFASTAETVGRPSW